VSSQRLIELDVLRVVAILVIVFDHEVDVGSLFPFFRVFPIWFIGLSLFFFISGYVIQRNYPLIDSRNKAMDFLKKRALRIYPLYWLALVVYFGLEIVSRGDFFQSVTGYTPLTITPLTISTAVIEIPGAQGLLAPRFLPEGTLALWFVGVILLYYLVYLFIAAFSCDTKQLALTVLGVFVFFVILRITLGIIDFRFFAYYALFVVGVVASKYNLLDRVDVKRLHTGLAVLLFVISMVAIAAFDHFAPTSSNIGDVLLTIIHAQVTNFSSFMVLVVALYTGIALVFIYASFNIARLVVPSLSKAGVQLVTALSFSSYAVYLFHEPFYFIFHGGVDRITHLSTVIINITFLVGLPILFLLCYVIQSRENDLVSWMKMRRQKSAPGLAGRKAEAEYRKEDR
jgi:peptidoglycan/LPS O-acetylase OafA/YrhL